MNNLFYDCKKLENINLSSFNTKKITNMSNMFYGCNNLYSLNLANFKTENVINMSGMFYGCKDLKYLDLSSLNTENVTNMNGMFYGCNNLNNLDLSSLNTKNVSDMSGMFYGCNNLYNLNLANFKTENVVYMNEMFYGCRGLKNINLLNINTEKVITMNSMFYNCCNLINLDLSFFITKHVNDMNEMFNKCRNLKNINLSNFDTKSVTNLKKMFYNCNNLIELNLTSFNTENVINMSNMFYNCNNLINLDLSSFRVSDGTDMREMFSNCNKLENLNLSSFSSYINRMFDNCNNLLNFNYSSFDTEKLVDMFEAEEFFIEFISEIKTKDKKDYLINKIKSIPFIKKRGDLLIFKEKILLLKQGKRYLLNLISNNNELEKDCSILIYDTDDKKSFKDIELLWNNNKIINKEKLTYLIGINFNKNENKIIPEAQTFAKLNKMRHISIYLRGEVENENDIKNLINDLLINLMKIESYYKISLLGGGYGGKTCFFDKLQGREFPKKTYATIGIDITSQTITKRGKSYYLTFFDTNGEERFRSIIYSYIKGSDCVIFIYDATYKESFNSIDDIYHYVKEYKEIQLIYLIGNKIDLIENGEREREVSEEEAKNYAHNNGFRFYEMSLKDNIGFDEFLDDFKNEIIKIKPEQIDKTKLIKIIKKKKKSLNFK